MDGIYGWGHTYVELVEQLTKRYLPLMHTCAPFHRVISKNNFDYDQRESEEDEI
jgi:hypothetical protein